MKFLVVVLSTFNLVFAASTIVKINTRNETMNEESKIIGGSRTDVEMTPSIVAILLRNSMICCGNLITARVVLSAAHCLYNIPISDLSIRSGSDYHDREGLVVAASGVTLHPRYKRQKKLYNFDIALMSLANSAIVPGIPANSIPLFDTDSFFPPGTLATISGWGCTEPSCRSGLSPVLRSLVVPVVPVEACASYGRGITIYNICAGYITGGKDPCKGDSGTGLIIDNKLAGVHSFGKCGRRNLPSGYASIPKFRDWIREQVHI